MVEGDVVELNSIVSESLTKRGNGTIERLTVDARRKDDLSLLGRDLRGVQRVARAADDLQKRCQ